MPEFTFRVLDESELRLYQAWFSDSELSRRIEPPTAQWYNYVRSTPGYEVWMVYDGTAAVGVVSLEANPDDHTAWVLVVVNPAVRRQGYGHKLLQALIQRPEATHLNLLKATVEPDNLASLRCLQKAGFIQEPPEPDDEGFLHFKLGVGHLHTSA
ncbi:MAG: GNAT family N-acetyltransferase [Anaerolinea sp.]|nr:GNAT family N-acetyltransferase [Anaerolinea sp.]